MSTPRAPHVLDALREAAANDTVYTPQRPPVPRQERAQTPPEYQRRSDSKPKVEEQEEQEQDEYQQSTIGNRIVAFVLWLLAVVATQQLVAALFPSWTLLLTIGVGVATQAIMTWMERPALHGRASSISIVVLLFDMLINAGGVFPLALRAAETPTAHMAVQALGAQAAISPVAAAVMSVILGFLLAASPEAVWNWRR